MSEPCHRCRQRSGDGAEPACQPFFSASSPRASPLSCARLAQLFGPRSELQITKSIKSANVRRPLHTIPRNVPVVNTRPSSRTAASGAHRKQTGLFISRRDPPCSVFDYETLIVRVISNFSSRVWCGRRVFCGASPTRPSYFDVYKLECINADYEMDRDGTARADDCGKVYHFRRW